MRYMIVLLFALATPLLAQTAEIDSLKTEVSSLNHQIQKAMSKEAVRTVTLDSALVAVGYAVQADTTDGDYIQLVLPDSLRREARLTLREAEIRFIKTGNPRIIRIHKNRLPKAVATLNP